MKFYQQLSCLLRCLLVLCGCVLSVPTEAESFQPLHPEIEPHFAPEQKGAEGGLWMVMDKAEADLRTSPNRLRDPALDRYLHEILCNLASEYCQDIRVYVIRTPLFNALMTPNGMMNVWTGLLLRLRNEDQLAAVMGHELGHYLRRHSLDRFEDVKLKANLATFLVLGVAGAVAAGGMHPDTGRAAANLGQLAFVASIFAYSRSQEREADKYGIQLMTAAGYDAREASTVWRNLIEEEEAAKDKKHRGAPFFASHPHPKARVEKLTEYANQLSGETSSFTTIDSSRFQVRIRPHIKMMLEDELNLNQFGRSEFLLNGLASDGVFPGLINFYQGELYRIRNDEGDMQLAKQYYNKALGFDDTPPEAHRSLGLLYLKSRNMALAKSQLTEYLELNPTASDREMIEYYLTMGD